jgi:hypothetical protein
VAKPLEFSFSIDRGDPVRLATAIRDIVAALEPLTDAEAGDVIRSITEMYQAPGVSADLLNALEGIVANHDDGGVVDESWWKAGRDAVTAAGGKIRKVRR